MRGRGRERERERERRERERERALPRDGPPARLRDQACGREGGREREREGEREKRRRGVRREGEKCVWGVDLSKIVSLSLALPRPSLSACVGRSRQRCCLRERLRDRGIVQDHRQLDLASAKSACVGRSFSVRAVRAFQRARGSLSLPHPRSPLRRALYNMYYTVCVVCVCNT